MAKSHSNQNFDGEEILLDGSDFHMCNFRNCTLIIEGKKFSMSGCGINTSLFLFQGFPAEHGLMMSKNMLSGDEKKKKYTVETIGIIRNKNRGYEIPLSDVPSFGALLAYLLSENGFSRVADTYLDLILSGELEEDKKFPINK